MSKKRIVGTVARGLRTPIIKNGDDIKEMAVSILMDAQEDGVFEISDNDILGITEAVVARAQGNYASADDIGDDIKAKFGDSTIGLIFPILSRNRFSICLKGIAKGAKKIVLMLSYPKDEVGNPLMDYDQLDAAKINPYIDVLSEQDFAQAFEKPYHRFTGVDYVALYKKLIEDEGAEVEVVFANDPREILNYTKNVIACDIHTRDRTKRLLEEAGVEKIFTLADILNEPSLRCGYNELFGILGSNKATEETVKLFPRDCTSLVMDIQQAIKNKTGKHIEVMVYGDGAFKDPVEKIWELADPVVSPGYTSGLEGVPNEIKIKYLADNNFAHLEGQELKDAISGYIKEKSSDLKGDMASQGTTPRRLTDLIGSLCDLTSGSGDKGTPFVYIQGYFDNYSVEE